MTRPDAVQMSNRECETLLDQRDTGVVSLSTAAGEPPHSFPVSFGYDTETSAFYFRVAADTDSKKGELEHHDVSFVTYDHDDNGKYRSVVAQGELERTTDEDIATEALAGLERVSIPFVDIFGEPPGEVEFEFYRLVPDRLTGRKETMTEP